MIFEEVPKDEKKIFFIKECGVFKCKKPLKYWFEDLGIYICEEHKKKANNIINEDAGII